MLSGGYKNETVLLTAGETITAREIVDTINQLTGRKLDLQFVSEKEFLAYHTEHDKGRKPRAIFEILASWWRAVARGELKTTDELMGRLLGRKPLTPEDAVKRLLQNGGDHTWHQNYA